MYHGSLPEKRDGYTTNEVPIGLKSDSVLTPDAPLRPTQTNIGHFFAKSADISERSYGVHKSEYSGAGDARILSGENEETVTRKIHHIRTGIHRCPEPEINKRCMANRIKRNEGLFANDINKVGEEVFKVSRALTSKPLPKLAEKQLFPRSVIYELDYIKAIYKRAMLEALEKERALFEQKLNEKKKGVLREKYIKDQGMKSNIMHLGTESASTKQVELAEKELRGHKLEADKDKVCSSACGTCGCTLTGGNCPKCYKTESKVYEVSSETIIGWKGDKCKEWPNKEAKYISSWDDERKAELLRVGYSFAKEAADWLYCTTPPFDVSKFYRPSKKKFPERSFSSLNI